ncbi:hypothetical protein GQ44DRAFT_622682 [Phaeosphaeriaceae sp. PMI808]|nr:hypothetical protein GQ44DRAFT_622682 [Phaeosphaeriaceae sp. PMI808]
MAPHSNSMDGSRIQSWTSSTGPGDFFKFLLLVSIIAIAIKSYTVVSLRRKRIQDHRSSNQEKESNLNQSSEEKISTSYHPENPNHHLRALRQELLEPDHKPIYPWISPPTQLPGPYDAPYYPLPTLNPTISLHSHELAFISPGQTQMFPYSRRVSLNNSSTEDLMLLGKTTVSSQGWRRTEWTVTTG